MKDKLSENKLNIVNGGNIGDQELDTDPTNSKYKKGMWVKFINADDNNTILDAHIERCLFDKEKGHWLYGFLDNNYYIYFFSADQIVTNSGREERPNND